MSGTREPVGRRTEPPSSELPLDPPREALRDRAESDFTPILRGLLALGRGAVGEVALVDAEGECVDYCAASEPDEARLVGACLEVALRGVVPPVRRLGGGRTLALHVQGERAELAVARVDEEYLLAARSAPDGMTQSWLEALERAARGIRQMAGLSAPPWEAGREGLRVRLRAADGTPGWLWLGGRLERIEAVVGRWEEGPGATGEPLFGYRVRTRRGAEHTVLYEPGTGRWYLGEDG